MYRITVTNSDGLTLECIDTDRSGARQYMARHVYIPDFLNLIPNQVADAALHKAEHSVMASAMDVHGNSIGLVFWG